MLVLHECFLNIGEPNSLPRSYNVRFLPLNLIDFVLGDALPPLLEIIFVEEAAVSLVDGTFNVILKLHLVRSALFQVLIENH